MELYDEAQEPFVPRTLRVIALSSPEPYEQETVILVSYRFFREATDGFKDSRNFTIRGYPVIAVPWLSDSEFEYRPPLV